MRLLILTQKVDKNDDVLGFFYFWIKEFAKHCQSITVIALEVGDYDGLPKNVRVLSLGKENKKLQLFKRLKYILNFYKYIWQERKSYDSVFVHMNPEYVVLGGLFWRAFGKRISLWYTHKAVNLKLRLAEILVDVIFTASRESFRLPSKKVKVLGHGIRVQVLKKVKSSQFEMLKSSDLTFSDTENDFSRPLSPRDPLSCSPSLLRRGLGGGLKEQSKTFKIITVGRTSPIKDYETLIKAIEFLNQELGIRNQELLVEIIGKPITDEDKEYFVRLQKMIKQKGLEKIIKFKGAVPNKEIINYLSQADLFAHMSRTGSLDKAILEAMAVGLPVISSNKAVLNDVLGKELKDKLGYPEGDAKAMAERIKEIMNLSPEEREKLEKRLRNIVESKHSLERLVKKIIDSLTS